MEWSVNPIFVLFDGADGGANNKFLKWGDAMLRTAICDDEENILLELEGATDRFFHTHCVDCRIQLYQSSENLWYDLQDGIYYDLLLLDIEMPQVSGMELAERIRDAFPAAKIIFITSHLEYAIPAYEFSVFRYIPKTQIEEKLPLALRDFYKLYCLEREEYYTIEIKNHVERLPYREILYVLKDGKYAVFHLQGGRTESVRKTLAQVFGEIGREYFCFADRGCIINLANVAGMDGDRILLPEGGELMIGRSNVAGFKAALLGFWGKQI